MISIDKEYVKRNGGLLASLSARCNEYLSELLINSRCVRRSPNLKALHRTVVHKDPHIDEYMADLLFRASLPIGKRNIDFMEMSVQVKGNDSNCKAYWPNAAVFGIGSQSIAGASPFMLFDEHLSGGRRDVDSCTQMVVNQVFRQSQIPYSIALVVQEVNEIDMAGNAHQQHIGQLMKISHRVRVIFKKGEEYHLNTQRNLDAKWKKALMDVCITSIVYCLENHIDLLNNVEEKTKYLEKSLDLYLLKCPFRDEETFTKTSKYIQRQYLEQKGVFKNAKLPISQNKDQLMILSRVAYAIEKCWGKDLAHSIMIHFWEMIYQGQSSLEEVKREIAPFALTNNGQLQTSYGTFQKISKSVSFKPHYNRYGKKSPNSNPDFWILSMSQTPRLILGNKPLLHFLNKYNYGFGIILLQDGFNCTNALFKGNAVPNYAWRKICNSIDRMEPGFWHIVKNPSTGDYAPFLINGNAAHQYVPHSGITPEILSKKIENIAKENSLKFKRVFN